MFIPSWFIPLVMTLFCFVRIFRPLRDNDIWEFELPLRLWWLAAASFIWLVYMSLLFLLTEQGI